MAVQFRVFLQGLRQLLLGLLHWLRRLHPALMCAGIGLALFGFIALRGLNIGPLDTDVIIMRAWYTQAGPLGFADRYFAENQRHPLAGPVISLIYQTFGEVDWPYHVIFQLSRVAQGISLTALLYALVRRPALAVSAGLALAFTPLRVKELYQGVNWFIEPTLALLLASSYLYVRSIQAERPTGRAVWYVSHVILYIISVTIYESGIPWIGVNLVLGWLARRDQPWLWRGWHTLRDAIPTVICGGALSVAVLFLWTPWSGLVPTANSSALTGIFNQFITVFNLPSQVITSMLDNLNAWPLLVSCLVIAGMISFGWLRFGRLDAARQDTQVAAEISAREKHVWAMYGSLLILGVVMVLAAIMIGSTGNNVGTGYQDRIAFGRSAGTAVLWVTACFAVASAVRRPRWGVILAAMVLIAPGYASSLIMQRTAQAARADIEVMTASLLAVNRVIYAPAYVLVITPRDWPTAKINDAADVVRHEVQQRIWSAGSGLVVDILRTRTEVASFTVLPGTCATTSGQASGGICLGADFVRSTRWTETPIHPNAEVVIVTYDPALAVMTPVAGFTLAEMAGYNIATAGPTTLQTNPAKVAVALR